MGILTKLFPKKKPVQPKTKTVIIKQRVYYPSQSGFRSGGAKWPYGLSTSGATLNLNHTEMRQNVREAFHDSLECRAIIESFADNVAGTGRILDATPAHELLGITPEAAEQWGADVSRRYHLYALDKRQHRSGTMNFYQAQRLYQICQHRDNDIFIRLYYSNSTKLQNPLQFEFLDANQIRGYSWTSTWAQLGADDGIERTPEGMEKKYKIWFYNPAKPGEYSSVDIPRIGEKSGKVMMIHGYNPEYAGQGRGYPRLAFALQELQNLTDLKLSVIKKAINQSNLVAFTQNMKKDPSNPMEGIQNQLQSAIGTSTISDESQAIIDELSTGIRLCPLPEAGLDTPGSKAVFNLEEGDELKPFQNTIPAEPFKDFLIPFCEALAAASGTSFEVVLKKFGQNYSASRATLVLCWRNFQMWADEMANDFLNEHYEAWLSGEIAAGRISAPGWNDPILRAAWLCCQWIGDPIPSIDPTKEATARKENLEMNLTTLDRESRNLNGSSAKDNILKNKKMFPGMPSPPWAKKTESVKQEENGDDSDIDKGDNNG